MIQERRDSIPRSRIRGTLLLAGAAVLAFLASRLLALSPWVVESVFVGLWTRTVIPTLSRMTGAVPVPVVELLALAYLGFRVRTSWKGLAGMDSVNRPLGTILTSGVLILVRDLSGAVLLFYALWGFHYGRQPLAERLELPAAEAIQVEELESLARELGDVANDSYLELHGRDDAEAPTAMPEDWAELHRALDVGWARTAARLPAGPLVTAQLGPPKPLLSSSLVAHLGLTGVYSPFTAEPLVVATTPAVSLGLSMAHEAAHQRGITGEGEATLMGFVAAMSSDHPLLRYSAAVRGQDRLLAALSLRDTSSTRALISRRLPGVRRDLADLREYARRHRGIPSRVATRVNDTYLRANRVAGGVGSYDRVTELLVRLARERGGTLETGRVSHDGGPARGSPALD